MLTPMEDQVIRLLARMTTLEHLVQILVLKACDEAADPVVEVTRLAEQTRDKLEKGFAGKLSEDMKMVAIEEGGLLLDTTVARMKKLQSGR